MKHKAAKYLMMTAIAIVLSAPASAATLKSESSVKGDVVTVGDVFDGAGDAAGKYLAPAPVDGKSLVLTTTDLVRISSAFKLDWAPSGHDSLIVRRAVQGLAHDDVANAVKKEISRTLAGHVVDVEMPGFQGDIHLPYDVEASFDVKNLNVDRIKGRFSAVIAAPAGADKPVMTKEVSGRLFEMVELPVLKNNLRNGDVISEHDLDFVTVRSADVAQNAITDKNALIGQMPRRVLGAMKPLMQNDIESPVLVKKGETVNVVLKNGALMLTMKAQAAQSGAEGETVRIVNTTSKKTLDAVVTGPQMVTIELASNAL